MFFEHDSFFISEAEVTKRVTENMSEPVTAKNPAASRQ
jgi:hypothetical protein|tara:strand:+ start:332 stop:445 length:114 start_codon:yes stop_codon:yes gene_type:complete